MPIPHTRITELIVIPGNYYVINQILSKGLHTADEECTSYTTSLMDKLEQVKNANVGNDAILDDVAAKAYIEQFAMETFQRADNAIHSNQASRWVSRNLFVCDVADLLSVKQSTLFKRLATF